MYVDTTLYTRGMYTVYTDITITLQDTVQCVDYDVLRMCSGAVVNLGRLTNAALQ